MTSTVRGLIDILLTTLDELAAVRTNCDEAIRQRDTAELRLAEVVDWLSLDPKRPERGYAVSLNELGINHLLGLLTGNCEHFHPQSQVVLGQRSCDDPLPPPSPRDPDPWVPLPEPEQVTVTRGLRWWQR